MFSIQNLLKELCCCFNIILYLQSDFLAKIVGKFVGFLTINVAFEVWELSIQRGRNIILIIMIYSENYIVGFVEII